MTERAADRITALDGIRGAAVLAVVAFHAGLPWARGGFLGVDAFFVLSGFVITRALLHERRRGGHIDLAAFWSRRLARLLPALLLVVAAVAVAALVHAVSGEAELRADAAAALLYVSNWRFMVASAGYFGSVGEPSLLQHTWSLGIEEQFYLLWPLVVVVALARRRPQGPLLVLAAGGAAGSAALQIGLALGGASESRLYFGSDVRVQALLLGATLAVLLAEREGEDLRVRARRAWHALALIGAATTAALWWQVDGTSWWLYRGAMTAAAVAMGAVIVGVILAPESLLSRVLRTRLLCWVGAISYGIYLWHWPVQLLLTRAATGLRGTPLLGLRFAVTVVIAVVSRQLIELPIRERRPPPVPRIAGFATVSLGLAALIGVTLLPPTEPRPVAAAVVAPAPTEPQIETSVQPTALAPSTSTVSAVTTRPPPTAPPTTAPPLRPTYTVAVLGDSVAQSLARGLAPVTRPFGLRVYDDAILGCGVAASGDYRLAGVEHGLADACAAWEAGWSDRLEHHKPDVALIQLGRHEVLDRRHEGRWTNILDPAFASYVQQQVDRSITTAGQTGSAVVVATAPYFRTGERPDGGAWPENDPARVRRFNEILRAGVARAPGAVLVDLGAHTNPDGRFTATVDGVRMRRDGVHYSAVACAWLLPWMSPQIRQAAASR